MSVDFEQMARELTDVAPEDSSCRNAWDKYRTVLATALHAAHELGAKDERNECAAIADGFAEQSARHDLSGGYASRHIADDIRARGNK